MEGKGPHKVSDSAALDANLCNEEYLLHYASAICARESDKQEFHAE